MTWFEELTGFSERSPRQVRENITLHGNTLTSLANGREMIWGQLETPSVAELRERVRSLGSGSGRISVRELVANVQDLHLDASNSDALFQVASQFNLLEMVSPSVTPERGVGIYEHDPTQGPACAIAAGAGTIYRNYFAPTNGQIGQSENSQIDCLADLGKALGNSDNRLWKMQNGYALATNSGLAEITNRLRAATESELNALRDMLRVGIQWNTQVTLKNSTHLVSQVYCSALPVAYSNYSSALWEEFGRLVLDASYEAAICTAILNWSSTGNNRVFLTLLGGGAFGNRTDWITDAIGRILKGYEKWNLDVAIVSYSSSNQHVQQLVEQLKG
jgi:hypothetical protein